MTATERIRADLREAMKARDTETVATLRMVVAAISTARAARGHAGEVTDDEVTELVTREARKRSEAARAYADAGRTDLADRETRELAIVRRYLPEQLSDEELAAIVDSELAAVGASGPEDLGRAMAAVMPRVRGGAEGRRVNELVRRRLRAGG